MGVKRAGLRTKLEEGGDWTGEEGRSWSGDKERLSGRGGGGELDQALHRPSRHEA